MMQNNFSVLLWKWSVADVFGIGPRWHTRYYMSINVHKRNRCTNNSEETNVQIAGRPFQLRSPLIQSNHWREKKLSAMIINASVDQLYWAAKPSEIFQLEKTWKRNNALALLNMNLPLPEQMILAPCCLK